MPESSETSISVAIEQLALALGAAGAVPRGELIRALERAAERLRARPDQAGLPSDLVAQAQAARVIGVSRQAVNQWVRKGQVRSFDDQDGTRRGPLVSLAEVTVAANRWRVEALPDSTTRDLTAFFEALTDPSLQPLAQQLGGALDQRENDALSSAGAHVLARIPRRRDGGGRATG